MQTPHHPQSTQGPRAGDPATVPPAQPHHTDAGPGLPPYAPGMAAAEHPYHDPRAHAYPTAYGAASPAVSNSGIETWFQFSNSGYLKGFLIGAGATLVLTNPMVQKTLVRGALKVWSLAQGGVEEAKEQVRDIKAEMSREKE